MKKHLFYPALWGLLILSLLSSCRSEDGAITQKQIEDKRFAVFVPKDWKPVNYADGFALVMKKYDEKKNTNLSGINNNLVINNLTASAGKRQIVLTSGKKDIYVEFNIRSETIEEKNGDKWVVYPRVQGTKVKELVVMLLTDKETLVKFFTYNNQTSIYKEYGTSFQEALDKYLSQSNKLNLNASIKPIAGGETLIKEVVITVSRGNNIRPGMPGEGEPGMGGDGAVDCTGIEQCIRLNPGGGGESTPPIDEADKIDITDLQKYPCAFAIAQDLPYLDNNIAKLLVETFGVSNKINVTFKTGDLGQHDGRTNMIGDKNYFNATITLDSGMLSTATKEFILATMYHEVLHAYLLYEWTNLGSSSFYSKYPAMESYDITFKDGSVSKKFKFIGTDQNHNRMGPFISGLKNAILQYNPKYPSDRAEALAMGGILDDSSMPKGYDKINQHEKDGSTAALGQRCNNN
ncbi:hypothetical protein ELBR111191_12670 [Elizabethkingia bruuniana]|uniref:hypothetical protein n=1 Tax=Elizabethkingia bruuniana TaxID=1756149 RepID=UPI000B1B8C1C|nr:hypothetical protein [Elizabethkingia bruuniana]